MLLLCTWALHCTACLSAGLYSAAGLYSQVKRAPKSKKVRKTYEVAGPGRPDAPSMDARARTIFSYFKKYNYTVTETGEVINFQGVYKASKAQAAATVFYVFCGAPAVVMPTSWADACSSLLMRRLCAAMLLWCQMHVGIVRQQCGHAKCVSWCLWQPIHVGSGAGMASLALVLTVALPFGGNYWYGLTALSPLAGAYYWSKGTRKEDFKVIISLCFLMLQQTHARLALMTGWGM